MDTLHNCLYSPGMTKQGEIGLLGPNVKHLRELRGIKVPDVARDLELTDNVMTLYQLEKRKSKGSGLAPKLADYFGIDLDVLLTKDLSGLTPEQIFNLNAETKALKAERAKTQVEVISTERDLISGRVMQRLFSLFLQSTDEGRQAILDAAELAPKIDG